MTASMLLITCLLAYASAQFPPKPEGVTTLNSKFHPGVQISYKETGLCETTPGVKSFAGYVHLPANALNETHEHNAYPINTFYWFFEARQNAQNAPLAIWLNGGPGSSSIKGALEENGPCFVANDSKSTYLNPWSWNNEVNLLFIDQPDQVGYSYDVLTNITATLLPDQNQGGHSLITPADFSNGVPEQNATFLVGTMSSQKAVNTANTTQHAVVALWHFAQTWFSEFPKYKPHDQSINLFTESYGGHYGPAIFDYFLRQNELIANGTITERGAHYLHLATLGIVNGCIDGPDMMESEIEFSYNNTYGVHAISKEQYEGAMAEFYKTGGVKDQIHQCRELQRQLDPHDYGDIAEVNQLCSRATEAAHNISNDLYVKVGHAGRFDITHELLDPFPPPYMLGWLNQAETQAKFGVPVNHSGHSPAVAQAFKRTGDMVKGGQLDQLAYILGHGVNVALIYGDRDFGCNWIGGERYSKNIPWQHQQDFQGAGYTPLVLSSPYTQSGGLTRQYGNLSFTRVYQAGHMVPSYQPEAAYRIFMRALTQKDIATGEIDLRTYEKAHREQYHSTGPKDTWWMKNDVLPQPPHECYILDMSSRCTAEEISWIQDGSAIIKDWILVGRNESSAKESPVPHRLAVESEAQIPLLQDL